MSGGLVMSTALLIIDVQNDYFKNGKMALYGSEEAGSKIKELLSLFREKSMPVIHIQHISMQPGAFFFLPETDGAEIHKDVSPISGEKVFTKHFPNSFRLTGLDEYLKEQGISKLVVVGMMTHMCVDTTVRAAFDLEYKCILVSDCCATTELSYGGVDVPAESVHAAFICALGLVFATVVTKDEALEMLK